MLRLPKSIFPCMKSRNSVELRVRDDGRGFNPQSVSEEHLGVNIMFERAEQIGGQLQVQSEPGRGTEIILTWSGTVVELNQDD